MTTSSDRARTQPSRRRRSVQRLPRRIPWGIAALLVAGTAAAVLVIAADPTAPAGIGPGGMAATDPTGARIDSIDRLAVGACVEIVPLPPDTVEMHRADCANATFALDSVQPRCPEHGKTVTRDGILGWCFTWLVSPGDCLDTARNARVACDTPVPDDGANRTYLKVLAVLGGERDGSGCRDPDRYLRAGRGENRGIACYDLIEPRTETQPAPRREPTTWAAMVSGRNPGDVPHFVSEAGPPTASWMAAG